MDASERVEYVKEIKAEIYKLETKQLQFGVNDYRSNRIKELSQRIGLEPNDEMADEQDFGELHSP